MRNSFAMHKLLTLFQLVLALVQVVVELYESCDSSSTSIFFFPGVIY